MFDIIKTLYSCSYFINIGSLKIKYDDHQFFGFPFCVDLYSKIGIAIITLLPQNVENSYHLKSEIKNILTYV